MGISKVSDFTNHDMITKRSDTAVLEIAKVMAEAKISSVPIVDADNGSKIVGIITERDLVRALSSGKALERLKAESVMSSSLLSVRDDAPIEEAAYIMLKNKVRHLLVKNMQDADIGIITATDLARYLKQEMVLPTAIFVGSQREEYSKSGLTSEVWELFF